MVDSAVPPLGKELPRDEGLSGEAPCLEEQEPFPDDGGSGGGHSESDESSEEERFFEFMVSSPG